MSKYVYGRLKINLNLFMIFFFSLNSCMGLCWCVYVRVCSYYMRASFALRPWMKPSNWNYDAGLVHPHRINTNTDGKQPYSCASLSSPFVRLLVLGFSFWINGFFFRLLLCCISKLFMICLLFAAVWWVFFLQKLIRYRCGAFSYIRSPFFQLIYLLTLKRFACLHRECILTAISLKWYWLSLTPQRTQIMSTICSVHGKRIKETNFGQWISIVHVAHSSHFHLPFWLLSEWSQQFIFVKNCLLACYVHMCVCALFMLVLLALVDRVQNGQINTIA